MTNLSERAFRPPVKDLGNAHLNLKTVKEFATLAKTKGVGLIHINTLITPDNGNRIISTEISGEGKTGTIVVFRKVHEIVEDTPQGATNKVSTKKEIVRRKLTSEKYVGEIQKGLPWVDIVGPITNTLTTIEKQGDKKGQVMELFNYAKLNGIESYDIT